MCASVYDVDICEVVESFFGLIYCIKGQVITKTWFLCHFQGLVAPYSEYPWENNGFCINDPKHGYKYILVCPLTKKNCCTKIGQIGSFHIKVVSQLYN